MFFCIIEYMDAEISSSGKKLELVVLKHDPMYEEILFAIPLVKKFISDNNLIIYGGTAIDYALRLKGDSIYLDDALKVPDLDFYSPMSYKHAYMLADILYDAGNLSARAIVGMHSDTMRVDIGGNHFIADIHYIPKEIFDKLPFILYESMRIIHPDFQRIDLHSSLAFPFDDPPREVIFNRWEKDVKRFEKLSKLYPAPSGSALRTIQMNVSGITKYIWNGALAYAAYTGAVKITAGTVSFQSPRRVCELIAMKPKKITDELGLSIDESYEPYAGILPAKIVCGEFEISSSHHRILSIIVMEIDGIPVRVVCIQYLLRHYAACAFAAGATPLGEDCWRKYGHLLELVYAKNPNARLSLNTYGSENISHSRRGALQKLYNAIDGTPFPPTPSAYFPATANRDGPNRVHPFFNPEANPIFSARGRLAN